MHTCRQAGRQMDTQTDRHRQPQTVTDSHRGTDTQADRQTDSHRDRMRCDRRIAASQYSKSGLTVSSFCCAPGCNLVPKQAFVAPSVSRRSTNRDVTQMAATSSPQLHHHVRVSSNGNAKNSNLFSCGGGVVSYPSGRIRHANSFD